MSMHQDGTFSCSLPHTLILQGQLPCKPVSGENQHMVGISRAGSSGAYFGGYTDPPRMHLGGGLGESEDLAAQLFLHRNSL